MFSLQKIINKSSAITISFFVFIIAILVFIHTRGFIYYDEGLFLQGGLRLINGDNIYKDFQFLYNPGAVYLNSLGFFIFGQSILSSRIIAFINSLICVFALFYIGKKLKFGNYLNFLVITVFVFLGPGEINFVWPVMLCLTTAFLSFVLFLKSAENKNKYLLILLAGCLSAVTFILKQNFGLAIFIANFIFFLSVKDFRNIKAFIWHYAGYAIIIFFQILYFLYTNSFAIYLKEIYYYTFVKIYQGGVFNSDLPWDYPSSFPIKLIKIIFYTSPLIISLISFILLRKNKNKVLLYIPIVSVFYYLLSIRPTTDIIHLTPLIAFSLPSVAIIFLKYKNLLIKIMLLLLVILFAYSAFFRNYYRWNPPLVKQNIYVSNPKLLISVDAGSFDTINKISDFFAKNAKNEKYTFIYNYAPAYYLILNKQNASAYDFLHYRMITDNDENQIVDSLKKKNVKYVISYANVEGDTSIIIKYFRKNYTPVEVINQNTIWELKQD